MQRNILSILIAVILSVSSMSLGVVITGSSTAPTQSALYDSGMTYAYSVGRAINTTYNQLRGGAVYIGQSVGYGWCLSAYHVTTIDGGIQQIMFDEGGTSVSYNITQVIRIASDADGTNADLCLLRLDGTPDVEYFDWRNLSLSSVSNNSTVTVVGSGRTRQDVPGTTYYTVNGNSYSQPTTYGQNKINASDISVDDGAGISMCYYFDWDQNVNPGGGIAYYEGAYTNGDSGGGMFYYNSGTDSWSLVGINVVTNATDITKVYFGQQNFAANLSYYVNDIETKIPEPATIALLVVGGAALLRRRRR